MIDRLSIICLSVVQMQHFFTLCLIPPWPQKVSFCFFLRLLILGVLPSAFIGLFRRVGRASRKLTVGYFKISLKYEQYFRI